VDDAGRDHCLVVTMAVGAEELAAVVTQPSEGGCVDETHIATPTSEVLPCQALLWTHLQDVGMAVLHRGMARAGRANPVHQRQALLMVGKSTHYNTQTHTREENADHTPSSLKKSHSHLHRYQGRSRPRILLPHPPHSR